MGPAGAGGHRSTPQSRRGPPRRTAVPEGAVGGGAAGRLFLPLGTGGRRGRSRGWRGGEAGGREASGAARQRAEHPASRDCSPRPAALGCAAPPGPAPDGAGRAAPEGGGPAGGRSPPRPLWATHPPPRARPAGPRRTHPHGPRAGPGPRASRSLPTFRSNHFSPGVISSGGPQK